MMDFDEMLITVGEFGIYQKTLFAFQAPFAIFLTFTVFGQLFMTLYPQEVWCEDNNLVLKWNKFGNKSSRFFHKETDEKCVFKPDDLNFTDSIPLESCKEIKWDKDISMGTPYKTILTDGYEDGWLCHAETYTTISQGVFFIGSIVGGFIIGWIADAYGRVPALVLANMFGGIGGALSVVTTNFYAFCFFRFITGMAFDNCFTMMYILLLEFCGPTYRTLVANLSIAIFYTTGTLILPGLALLVNDWKIFGLCISLPMIAVSILGYFILPESSRFLLSKGKTKEATDILRKFARINRRDVDDEIFEEFQSDAQNLCDEMTTEEAPSFLKALKTPRLRMTFFLLIAIWSIVALVYDGHSRNVLNLAKGDWNLFAMFALASATELPADVLLIFTLDVFGRRWLAFGTLFASGVCSLIAAFLPDNTPFAVTLVMAIVARFFVNVAFNIGMQFAAELLPTVIRAQGVNAIHISGYIASIISPFIASIGRTEPALSLIILGLASMIGGTLSLFLSETLGELLPNSLEEAEVFGKDQSFWNCPACQKPKVRDENEIDITEADEKLLMFHQLTAPRMGSLFRSSMVTQNTLHFHNSRRWIERRGGVAERKEGDDGGIGGFAERKSLSSRRQSVAVGMGRRQSMAPGRRQSVAVGLLGLDDGMADFNAKHGIVPEAEGENEDNAATTSAAAAPSAPTAPAPATTPTPPTATGPAPKSILTSKKTT